MSTQGASSTFEQLHPAVRKWIWDQDWRSLRPIQERSIPAILAGEKDVVISAATAGGKTEAAFLPIVSALASSDRAAPVGLGALYVGPLKALINDQARRLEGLFSGLGLPVHRWHGDVSSSRKKKLLDKPSGLLLITPESLEALFIRQGPRVSTLFAGLRFVVIDELHAFIGTERGEQLQSLLHRIEVLANRRVPRVALSATLGDMDIACEFLRPGGGTAVYQVVSKTGGQEVRVQVRTYLSPHVPQREGAIEPESEEIAEPSEGNRRRRFLEEDLFELYRGGHHLIFANRRADVELYSDRLRRLSESRRLPNEFWPHHGSLSKELREEAEDQLRLEDRPATVLATTTLELGIDVGRVQSVGQIGPPLSVAGLRQRLGRSGRRGEAAELRIFVHESEPGPDASPVERLHTGLVQSVAVVGLLAERWFEPPATGAWHLSTLVQQVLSVIAEKGGIHAAQAFTLLCRQGAFRDVDATAFQSLLRDLGRHELIQQVHTGELVLDLPGERLVNHYDFYAAFQSAEEYRMMAKGKTLGSLPVAFPLLPGTYIVFAGRRWQIEEVDEERKVVHLRPAPGGRVPNFPGGEITIHDRIRQAMKSLYCSDHRPAFADQPSLETLRAARSSFEEMGLAEQAVFRDGKDLLIFPWRGSRVMNTLLCLLGMLDFDIGLEGVAVRVCHTAGDRLRRELSQVLERGLPPALELARQVPNKQREKHHHYLCDDLLAADYASSQLDLQGAEETLRSLTE